jgi:hypothetical protein
MRLIARVFVFASLLLIILYGILPGFLRIEGNFVPSYVAGKSLLRGIDPIHFYKFPEFQKFMDANRLTEASRTTDWILPIIASTPSRLIFDALMAIPPATVSRVLLTAVNLISLILLAHASAKVSRSSQQTNDMRQTNSPLKTAYLVFLSSSFSLAANFRSSEPFVILALFFVVAFLAFMINAERISGLILGILFPFEMLFGIPAILFLIAKRWRLFTYFVLSSLFMFLLTYLVVGGSAFTYYLQRILPFYINGRIQNPFSISYQTAWSLFRKLFLLNATLNPTPMVASKNIYVLSYSLFEAFIVVPSTYFFYRGVERKNTRESLIASSFPIIFLSPTGATPQLLLLGPAIVCLAQAALEERQISVARLFIVLYALACIPLYSSFVSLFKVTLPLLLYERFFLLLAIYIAYLIFQLRTLPRHLFAWRMTIAGTMIVAIATILYLGNKPQGEKSVSTIPALKTGLGTAAFSPAPFKDGMFYIGFDSASRTYAVKTTDGTVPIGTLSLSRNSFSIYHISTNYDGTELAVEMDSDSGQLAYFTNNKEAASYPAELCSISQSGNFGAFVHNGDLYVVNMRIKPFLISDSLKIRPFKITQFDFDNENESSIVLLIDSLDGTYSIGEYNLLTRKFEAYLTLRHVSFVCARQKTIYFTYENTDSTYIYYVPYENSSKNTYEKEPVKLMSVHGNIIDLYVTDRTLYFSSDFERGFDLPTIYRCEM